MKTLADPEVRRRLAGRYVLTMHNQLPELYCNDTVDPGVDRYPGDMVDRCPEGAGGGNVRTYVCTPDGRVVHLTLGYWKPARFLVELEHAATAYALKAHVDVLVRHHSGYADGHVREGEGGSTLEVAQATLLARGHLEAATDLGRPIAEVLGRVEDEIFLSGKIG